MGVTVTEIGSSNTSANPASTVSVTTTAVVDVGEILFFSFDLTSAAATTATATATAGGNAMTQDGTSSRGTGTTNPTIFLYRYEPGSQLASGATVSATVTNAGTGSAAKCIKVAGLSTGVGLNATLGTGSNGAQAPTTGASGTPPSGDEIFALAILGVFLNTAGQSGSPSGSYTALTEVVQTTRSSDLVSAYKDIAAPAGAQTVTWTPTWGANKSSAGLVALYKVAPAGGGSTVKQLAALGAG